MNGPGATTTGHVNSSERVAGGKKAGKVHFWWLSAIARSGPLLANVRDIGQIVFAQWRGLIGSEICGSFVS